MVNQRLLNNWLWCIKIVYSRDNIGLKTVELANFCVYFGMSLISACFDWQIGADGENHIRVGKLNLVDLAGSERQNKTQAEVSNTSSMFWFLIL